MLTRLSQRSFSISDWHWMSASLEKGDMRSSDEDEDEADDCSQASSTLLPVS
jgi:hypothetical protein